MSSPTCPVAWGSHGCSELPGHEGVHVCGPPPNCSEFDGGETIGRTIPGKARYSYDDEGLEWSEWMPTSGLHRMKPTHHPKSNEAHQCDGTCLPRDPWPLRGRHEARRYRINPRAVGRHEDFQAQLDRFIDIWSQAELMATKGLISEQLRRRVVLEALPPLPPLSSQFRGGGSGR